MNGSPINTIADRLLTEVDAADRLAVSVRTLQQWRVSGGGPRFVKIGRCVRYTPADLLAFVNAGARANTSEGVH